MKRTILVTIDAGETTCDGCTYLEVGRYCSVFDGLMVTPCAPAPHKRLPECLDAERSAAESRTGGAA